MEIDLAQLPIPDWGLTCPTCGYPLQGLPSYRCPECGKRFNIRRLIRPWTRLRPPRFTGQELPAPDFGLTCAACGHELAGARTHQCPRCGSPFDPQVLRPRQTWFVLEAASVGELPIPIVQAALAAELIPYAPVEERTVAEHVAGHGVMFSRLRIPSEFYFDVLWLLQEARRQVAAVRARGDQGDWKCAQCGEDNPGHFEVCWNCERVKNSA